MDKNEVIKFFDEHAESWDAEMIKDDDIIGKILDYAEVSEGKSVLDIACGTGVLFPYYLSRNVKNLTGIDISEKMCKIASEKFPNVKVIHGDADEYKYDEKFDCIVIYNAIPHFENAGNLIRHLSQYLKPNGRLTIAHGMSRKQIDHFHEGSASKVSNGLMHEDDLTALMSVHLTVDIKISDEEKYIVSGYLKG